MSEIPHTLSELPKHFDPAAVEQARYAQWEAAGVFHEEPDPARPPFIIAMPPPNVTGAAHLGHGSTYTAMDVLVRYHRMLGDNADWIPGLDHAAIATEAVVVRELAKEGQSRESLGRERFLQHAWAWYEKYGQRINEQFRRLGFGADWKRSRFTMDPECSAAVIDVFVQLYREGLIYRGTRLINWDPRAHSTLSDAEIDYEERDASLWFIRYMIEDGSGDIVVATTRPETMLGDTAVAVHPDDARYRAFVGKHAVLPLTERRIPIIADAAVEPEFGTGAVKVTPAHDPLDNEIGERHKLEMRTVIDLNAQMTGDVGKYLGMDRYEARAAIVADLAESGALVKTQPYRQRVALSSRSHEVIEPLLSLQWFVDMKPLAEPALKVYREGKIRFVPPRFGKTYESWLENIRDWNISRQIWWGHQLPVWYTPDDQVVVAANEEEARTLAQTQYGTSELRRDPDTLDTWFSSGLWPFSILGWPNKTPELAHWYPTQTLLTAREIIFLWVCRMVMLGLKFAGDIPFHEVVITPLVFDEHGRKMSKSLGNAIDPMDLIEKYGADATRFGIIRQMHLDGQDLNFNEGRCDEAAKFNNKIWNALRYTMALPEGLPSAGTLPPATSLSLADRWILTRLRATARAASDALDAYRMGEYTEMLLHFIWYELCDWYIEATKLAPQSGSGTPTRAAVLSYVLNAAMRLLHPISPFISEEVWLALPHDGATIVTASWPDSSEIPADEAAAARYASLIPVIERARATRATMGLGPKAKLTIELPELLDAEERALIALHAVAEVVVADGGIQDRAEALAAVTVRVPESVRRERLASEIAKLTAEVDRAEKKLANESFVAKAPPETVALEREKRDQYAQQLARARGELTALERGPQLQLDVT